MDENMIIMKLVPEDAIILRDILREASKRHKDTAEMSELFAAEIEDKLIRRKE